MLHCNKVNEMTILNAQMTRDFIFNPVKYGLDFNLGLLILMWRTLSTALELESWGIDKVLTPLGLREENHRFRATGGVSQGNRHLGFMPAFQDTLSGCVYPSRCADGRPAPIHTLDGLPNDVVLERDLNGRTLRVKPSVIAGFVREGQFYTREQVAHMLLPKGTIH